MAAYYPNIRTDRKEDKFSLHSQDEEWSIAYRINIALKEIFVVSAKIMAVFEDQSQVSEFLVEGVFSNEGGRVVNHGTTVKRVSDFCSDASSLEVRLVPSELDRDVLEVGVKGSSSRAVSWNGIVSMNIRKVEGQEYTGYPRLQISIVGMEDSKKLGFMGLRDGINYVLRPNNYTIRDDSSPVYRSEIWEKYVSRRLNDYTYWDMLSLQAHGSGPGTSVTTGWSQAMMRWYTYSGDFGGGNPTCYLRYLPYYSGMDGGLKHRTLSNSCFIGGVTFLWSRFDVQGWLNYPRPVI